MATLMPNKILRRSIMKRKMGLYFFTAGVLMSFVMLGLVSCFVLPKRGPDISEAKEPKGLSIDPENCAYLFGSIYGIDNYEVEPNYFNLQSYFVRGYGVPVRVPAGKELIVLIMAGGEYVNTQDSSKSWSYTTKQSIRIPPLENGKMYRITTGQYYDIPNGRFTSFVANFEEYNTSRELFDRISYQEIGVNPPVLR
jgi:hypothetical protein